SHRKEKGVKAWQVIKGRLANLCITYLDSEIKSGANTARDLAKMMMPGKQAAPDSITEWISNYIDKDGVILITDDFVGTGETLASGLRKFFQQSKMSKQLQAFAKTGRILCYVLYAFPQAIEKLRRQFPEVQFFAANVFG